MTVEEITQQCDAIKKMLILKNEAYGNSVSDPIRIFSNLSPVEALNVRIDDKLSRIARGHNAGEDTELDLIGYLILKRCILKL